jgi:hypothetical protein
MIAIKIMTTIINMPCAVYSYSSLIYNSLNLYHYCNEKNKEHQCFFFTRGCELCLESEVKVEQLTRQITTQKPVEANQMLVKEQSVNINLKHTNQQSFR